MKYSELDFKGGLPSWDIYRHYPEDQHFTKVLTQDLLTIDYSKYTIYLGWYYDRYAINIVPLIVKMGKRSFSDWNPFYTLLVFKHEEVFEKLQEVINNSEKYYNLKVFS